MSRQPLAPLPPSRRSERGQSMAEFSLMMPILVLLFFGMAFAGWYAFRATASDWAVFISGVARGSYNTPADARSTILFPDIRAAVETGAYPSQRQVRSSIAIDRNTPWLYGLVLNETHKATVYFRLWRFYPGPPPPGGYE